MASKEALARQFGATHFVDASVTDAVEEIRTIVPHGPQSLARALGPGGVTWSFECVGHPAVLRNAVDALDWGGQRRRHRRPGRGAPRSPSTSTTWPTSTAAFSAAATARPVPTTTSP